MKEITITIKSEMENITNMRNVVVSLISNKNQTISFINELKTIISEAITNAIVHGYDNDQTKDIIIKIKMDDKGIDIIIDDFGKGIEDVSQAREALFTTNKENERSGLGFTIMELFSTKLEVKSKVNEGTSIHIYKEFE